MKIVTKLALNRIKMKKSRSTVICGAILLTMILFMTIVSIASNIFTGYSLMLRLASGTDYHGYLRGASFGVSGEELRDLALASEEVAEASISSNLASFALRESEVTSSNRVLRTLESERDLAHFYTDLTDGSFPSSDDEILVNSRHFPDANVGDLIGIYYEQPTEKGARTAYAEFTVSGLMKSRADTQLEAILAYSDTLIERYGFADEHLSVYFMLTGRRNLTAQYEHLTEEILGEYRRDGVEKLGALNPAYLETVAREAATPGNVILVLFLVAVVFFCSFLLIYNIYSIALTQDMQAFGLLSVVGTTHKQLRRMICTESLMLFAVTLPVGLVGGYFIGWKILSPMLFSSLQYEGVEFEFNPLIVVLTLLLTVATLLWSATRPLKKLAVMTPIATVEYSPSTDLSKNFVRRKSFARRARTPSTLRLALNSIARNRKKTVITALSMSLSVILFMLISTVCEYMITFTESEMQLTDYIVKLNRTFSYSDSPDEYTVNLKADLGIGIADSVADVISQSPSAEKVRTIRTEMLELSTSPSTREHLTELESSFSRFEVFEGLTEALNGKLKLLAVGVPDELYRKLLKQDSEPFDDLAADELVAEIISFGDGERSLGFSYFDENETVRIGSGDYRVRLSESVAPEYIIMRYLSTDAERAVLFLPESIFLRELGEGLICAILVDAREDCLEIMRSELEQLTKELEVSIADWYVEPDYTGYTAIPQTLGYPADIIGRYDRLEQMRSIVMSIETVSYSLASMIFLVGVLNIVNTSLSSVFERRRELAMLESIGMTDRQMMRMLLGENLCGVGIAAAITLFIGYPLILLIVGIAMDALVTPDLISGGLMLVICTAVSLICAAVVFRLIKSDAVAERIKVE